MTDYPYEPPERMFSDTMLAFRDFERTRAHWRLRKWFYAAADRVVVPLGYHHGDDCGDYR